MFAKVLENFSLHFYVVFFSPKIMEGEDKVVFWGPSFRQWDGSHVLSKSLPILEFLDVLLPKFGD